MSLDDWSYNCLLRLLGVGDVPPVLIHDCAYVFQVKILVPNSTAGMIIGKGGNFIKQIKEESGAYVQISQKSKETNLPERCITVAGNDTLYVMLRTLYKKRQMIN